MTVDADRPGPEPVDPTGGGDAPVDGWRPLTEGRQAEVFLRPDGRVVKLMRDDRGGPWIQREATAMRALREQGVPVPAVVEIVEVDGRAGLVMERVEGRDLFQVLGARPWLTTVLGRRMGALHAAVHARDAPGDLPRLHDFLEQWITDAGPLSSAQRRSALDALADVPTGDRLAHGDFHLGNLIGEADDPVIIDWGGATRADPVADVAQTVLLHRVGQPGPGTPRLVRTLAPVGAWALGAAYLAGYRQVTPVDRAATEAWIPVLADARLYHGIVEEEPGLRRIVRRAFGS
mgnify:FL=1